MNLFRAFSSSLVLISNMIQVAQKVNLCWVINTSCWNVPTQQYSFVTRECQTSAIPVSRRCWIQLRRQCVAGFRRLAFVEPFSSIVTRLTCGFHVAACFESWWHKLYFSCYGRPLSVSGRPCYILPMFLFIYFLWPPYSPALVNRGSRKFYTWWTLSVIREVSSWIFSWLPSNYRVGQKVTKFGVFWDPTRKLSALTPERGRIL